MQLGARLRMVADLFPAVPTAADIGTDHAYLPLVLLQEKRVGFVIAGDKNQGPCEAAARTIREAGMEMAIDVRRGDGLAVLKPAEVQAVSLAGMGGKLMCAILEASPAVLQSLQVLVLQPMTDQEEVRCWLYQHGWHIEAEALALEDGHLYEIMRAVPGREPLPEKVLLAIGPVLWREKPPLLQRHVGHLLQKARQAADGMEQSPRARNSGMYRELCERIKALEAKNIW